MWDSINFLRFIIIEFNEKCQKGTDFHLKSKNVKSLYTCNWICALDKESINYVPVFLFYFEFPTSHFSFFSRLMPSVTVGF